jgi:hypothetical protein
MMLTLPQLQRRAVWDSVGAVTFIGECVLFSPFLRKWFTSWGATESEFWRALPGDELIPKPTLRATRALTIHASPEEVWPWIVQMGQGKGGLYSYDVLENLVGCDIHSADQVLPWHQRLRRHDVIRMGPKGYPLYRAAAVEADHRLLLVGADPQTGDTPDFRRPPTGSAVQTTWGFYLEPLMGGTRLLVRTRMRFARSLRNILMWRVLVEPIHFVMERRMLLGIQERAEALQTGREV